MNGFEGRTFSLAGRVLEQCSNNYRLAKESYPEGEKPSSLIRLYTLRVVESNFEKNAVQNLYNVLEDFQAASSPTSTTA